MRGSFVIVMVIAATVFISPQLWAKSFYLKNGEEIEYQSYRQKDGRIFVRINRDTEVDFTPEEVDLKKTVKSAEQEKKKVRHKKRAHHKAAVKPKASKVEAKKAASAAAKPASAAKPEPAATPAPAPAKAKPAPAAKPAAAAPAAAKPSPAAVSQAPPLDSKTK